MVEIFILSEFSFPSSAERTGPAYNSATRTDGRTIAAAWKEGRQAVEILIAANCRSYLVAPRCAILSHASERARLEYVSSVVESNELK